MPLAIPQSVNYPSPLTPIPSRMQDEPKNGRKQITAEIDWNLMGGAQNCVSFNVQFNGTLNFEQISFIHVDNSQCAADVIFMWPDTSMTTTVPAGLPLAMVPVLSNALSFFVNSPGALLGDITRFTITNYPVMPVDLPTTAESQTVGGGGSPIQPETIQLIAAGLNGTLENLFIGAAIGPGPTASANATFVVQDGNGSNLAGPGGFVLNCGAGEALNAPVCNLTALNWRFRNGLKIIVTAGSWAGAVAQWNSFASYKQP